MRIASTIVLLLVLSACTTTPTTGPRATVEMRDGTAVSGMVLSSTAAEIKITGDDNVTRTISMAQVRSVDYGEAPPAPAAAAAPAAGAAPGAAPAARPTMAAARPAARRPVRPAIPPPTADDITTDTHVLQSGTEISVQTQETIDGSTAADGQIFVADVTEQPCRQCRGGVLHPPAAVGVARKLRHRAVHDRPHRSGRQHLPAERGGPVLGVALHGGGAAIGGIVGALLGGAKGAAIGAGAGAGGGTVAQALTKGNIRVEAETILTFKLDKPLRVVERRR